MKKLPLLIASLIAVGSPCLSHAEIVSFEFAGLISYDNNPYTPSNDSIRGDFSYDSTASIGSFGYPLLSFSATVNGVKFSYDGGGPERNGISVIDGIIKTPDAIYLHAWEVGVSGGDVAPSSYQIRQMQLQTAANSSDIITNNSLPTNLSAFGNPWLFDLSYTAGNTSVAMISFVSVTPVPEGDGLLLTLTGLTVAAARRKKYRAKPSR